MSNSDSKSETTIRLDIEKPTAVAMNTSEGERVLKALHKLHDKLNGLRAKSALKSGIKLKTNVEFDTTSDQLNKLNKSTNTSVILESNKNDKKSEIIESRLQLIERQLQYIVQLMTAHSQTHLNPYPTPSPSAVSAIEEQTDGKTDGRTDAKPDDWLDKHDDRLANKFVDKCVQTGNEMTMNSNRMAIIKSKSKSNDCLNKISPTKHFHLNPKDIPFILGTCSKSHSVIANRQLMLFKLKQHNQLCERRPSRKIYNENFKARTLNYEINELLYDLQEEHNYICE